MCGIAGIVDLRGNTPIPPGRLRRMADAMVHRGPDDEGYFEGERLGLANRRLSIVGLADGRQPITNEDGSVVVVFNGELFDCPELKPKLEAQGHRFATHCDTELIAHLWEDHQERMFEHLRGQFALAVWDQRRRQLILARDRFGICPLYWSRQASAAGDWLLFASEIKALLASGLVEARPDVRGIDQVFHFLAVPGPATCFQGVQLLQPGHYLRLDLGGNGRAAPMQERTYWAIDFPDRGEEERGTKATVDEFERLMVAAVERRLRADVPVVSYVSGGIDSSLVAAIAARVRGEPIPNFTVQIKAPRLDESRQAAIVSRHIGAEPIVVPVSCRDCVTGIPYWWRTSCRRTVRWACASRAATSRCFARRELEDKCVHRRLKLSVGKVVNDKLRCAYHGWSYTTDGHGESPGTPKLYACAKSYACLEAYGAIWVRERDADQPPPDLMRRREGSARGLLHALRGRPGNRRLAPQARLTREIGLDRVYFAPRLASRDSLWEKGGVGCRIKVKGDVRLPSHR